MLTGKPPELLEFTNLSMGGLFVKTMAPLKVGSVVDLELRVLGTPFNACIRALFRRS